MNNILPQIINHLLTIGLANSNTLNDFNLLSSQQSISTQL